MDRSASRRVTSRQVATSSWSSTRAQVSNTSVVSLDLRLPVQHADRHVVATVGADRRRKAVLGQLRSQVLDQAACHVGRAVTVPRTGRVADGDQRAQQPPRRRWPLDQALVDVVAQRRRVVTPGGEPKSEGYRHDAYSFPVAVSAGSPDPSSDAASSGAFPFLSSSSNVTFSTTICASAVGNRPLQIFSSGRRAAGRSHPRGRVASMAAPSTCRSHAVRRRIPWSVSARSLYSDKRIRRLLYRISQPVAPDLHEIQIDVEGDRLGSVLVSRKRDVAESVLGDARRIYVVVLHAAGRSHLHVVGLDEGRQGASDSQAAAARATVLLSPCFSLILSLETKHPCNREPQLYVNRVLAKPTLGPAIRSIYRARFPLTPTSFLSVRRNLSRNVLSEALQQVGAVQPMRLDESCRSGTCRCGLPARGKDP